jgi:Glucodextranase, domain B
MRPSLLLLLPLLSTACKGHEEEAEALAITPSLVLEAPAAASWQAAGQATASGTATQCDSVTVDGVDATLRAGAFETKVDLVRGINLVEAVGLGANGDEVYVRQSVIAGDYNDPGQLVRDAMVLRLNQGGLDTAMALVASMIDSETIEATVVALNPVYTDTYGVWGWDAVTISADVTELSFDEPKLTATPTDGLLELTVVLPDVYVGLRAYGDVVGIDFDTTASLAATAAVVTADLSIAAVDGKLQAEMSNPTVSLEGFSYDTSLLPGDIEAYVFVDTIRATIEEQLLAQIEEMVPSLLDETLAGLDPSFETELIGVTVSVEAEFSSASIDPDGVEMTVDVDVDVPSSGNQTYAGYLAAGPADPRVDTHSDLSGSISDDLLNRVLFEAWRGGALAMEMSTEDGSLSSALLIPLKATQGSISISADLPPVVVDDQGALQAQMGELQIRIETPDGELGTYLDLSAHILAPIDVVLEAGELVLDIGDVDVTLMVRDSDWGASNEATTALVESMLPVSTLMALLGDFSFPIPSLLGIQIDSAEVYRDNSGVYTGLEAELSVAQ